MNRLILSVRVVSGCATALFMAIAEVGTLAAQSPASINNEPHHKRLLYTNDLRLWEVTLPPGQSTPAFVHDYDVATVVIDDGALAIQRNNEQVAAPAAHARGSVIVAEQTGAPATYRIENTGTTDYRAFEIENMREGRFPAATTFTAPGSSVLKESRAFTIYDVLLKAGAPDVTHDHTGPTIVVLIDGALQQGGIGGTDPVRIQQPGQWLVIPRFQAHSLSAGDRDAHAIEIEVR
jgi:quercetin dioxygenase-like cupin family protein